MPALVNDHIRLMSIHLVDSNLILSREHVHLLSNAPPYIALSYTWGTSFEDVICDGASLTVPSNLHQALSRLAVHFPDRLFWTDSLCINQDDIGEKCYQVSIMGRIFSQAQTVVVWLGEVDIHDKLCELADNSTPVSDALQQRMTLLHSLSQLSWFYRAWTFQEIRLAAKAVVILGDHIMLWQTFISKIQSVRSFEPHLSTIPIRSQPISHSRFTYIPQDRFFSIIDQLNISTTLVPMNTTTNTATSNPSSLADLLFLTWYRDATLRHDKIYSLLGSELLPESPKHGLEVDYTISWSTLCIKAARAALTTSHDLKILKIAGMMRRWVSPTTNKWDPHELSQLLNHPSWAPDWWAPPQQTRSLNSLVFDERSSVFASLDFCCPPPRGNNVATQDISDTSPFLVLHGVFLGVVNIDEGPTWPGGPLMIHPVPTCASVVREVATDPTDKDNIVPKVVMSSFVEDVNRHLASDCPCVPFHERQLSSSHIGLPPQQITRPRFDSFYSFSLPNQASAPDPNKPESAQPAQVLASSVESGDFLFLLEGGGLPFVLRPLKDVHGRVPRVEEFGAQLPWDAGLFVLIGEASLCWDQICPDWGGRRDMFWRVGKVIIV